MEVNGQLREVKLPLREVRPAPKNPEFLVPARATRPLHKERAPAKNRKSRNFTQLLNVYSIPNQISAQNILEDSPKVNIQVS